MKYIKIIISTLLIVAVQVVEAQKIDYQDKKYTVKKDLILLDGEDITASLTESEQTAIKNALKYKMAIGKAKADLETAKMNLDKAKRKYHEYSIQYQKDLVSETLNTNSLHPGDPGFYINKQNSRLAKLKQQVEAAEKEAETAENKLSRLVKKVEK